MELAVDLNCYTLLRITYDMTTANYKDIIYYFPTRDGLKITIAMSLTTTRDLDLKFKQRATRKKTEK